jgi:integrase
MSRTVRDSKLETRASRDRLPARKRPHWRTLVPGLLHLGYRKRAKGAPGVWLVRRYVGAQRYRVAQLGLADDYQDAGGSLRVMAFADAQRAALAHKASPRGGALTVATVIADYIAWLKVHRATGDGAAGIAAVVILPKLGHLKVADLTTTKLNHWRDALAAQGAIVRSKNGAALNHKKAPTTAEEKRARKATVNRTITILKAALNKAFNDGLIAEDTEWRRFKPFNNVHAARPGYLTIAEAQRLINAAAPDFRNVVHAALLTGARYGELRALRVRDFHRGKVAIHQSKSGKPRDIVLTDEGIKFFTQLTAGRAADAPMLIRADGEQWIKNDPGRRMRKACAAANIAPAVGIHQLRHTWASHAVMNGMPLLVVARNLGHANTTMVEKHYGHLATTYIDEQVRAGAPTFGAVEASNVVGLRR